MTLQTDLIGRPAITNPDSVHPDDMVTGNVCCVESTEKGLCITILTHTGVPHRFQFHKLLLNPAGMSTVNFLEAVKQNHDTICRI